MFFSLFGRVLIRHGIVLFSPKFSRPNMFVIVDVHTSRQMEVARRRPFCFMGTRKNEGVVRPGATISFPVKQRNYRLLVLIIVIATSALHLPKLLSENINFSLLINCAHHENVPSMRCTRDFGSITSYYKKWKK